MRRSFVRRCWRWAHAHARRLHRPPPRRRDFPSRPVRLVVPFAAGGGIDITARMAAEKISEILGQQIVVQNQGGAGGAIATAVRRQGRS